VPETPKALFTRVQREGLRMPPVEEWDTWPFDGELGPRALQPPVDTERPRIGEDAADCWRCQKGDESTSCRRRPKACGATISRSRAAHSMDRRRHGLCVRQNGTGSGMYPLELPDVARQQSAEHRQ
jgi:hypothetical protein